VDSYAPKSPSARTPFGIGSNLQGIATPATLRAAMPTIGVIVVSYNTRELLRACLESLRGCTLPLRVVVVDGASADGSPTMVRAVFPEVCLVEPGRNTGFAAGNNIGLRRMMGVGGWGLGVGKLKKNPSSAHRFP
jgi:glycosyl transferase family 2